MSGWRVLALLLVAAASCLGLPPARAATPAGTTAASPNTDIVWIDHAQLASARGVETVRLPHVLQPEQFDARGQAVTYRLTLDLDTAPSEPLGLYLRKVSLAGKVRVNGLDAGGCGPGPLDQLRCLYQPTFVSVGPGLWRAGPNTVEVQVWATQRQFNGLSALAVGPEHAVHERLYRPDHFWRHDLVVAFQWATLAIGLLALMMWTIGQSQRVLMWFGLASTFRGLSNLNLVTIHPWGDMFWTHWVLLSSRMVLSPLAMLMLLAFSGHRFPKVEKVLVGACLALPMIVLASGNDTSLAQRVSLPLLFLAIGLVGRVAVLAWRTRDPMDVLTSALGAGLIAAGAYDLALLRLPSAFERSPLLPYTTGFILLTLGGVLAMRFARALHTSDNLNRILAERVALVEADLKKQHQTIVDLERAHARSQEREQLLRDLHDGLGSSLSTARLRLEDGSLPPEQLRRLLDECIDDMRLLLDTSMPDGTLADALGSLRYRMEHRLAGSGLSLSWRIGLGDKPTLAAAQRLQVMRLLQEALANALRHAHASHITISAGYEPTEQRLRLSVQDDGVGFAVQARQGGRGLANMRHRAQQLGATLQVNSDGQGTRIELAMPLAQGA